MTSLHTGLVVSPGKALIIINNKLKVMEEIINLQFVSSFFLEVVKIKVYFSPNFREIVHI